MSASLRVVANDPAAHSHEDLELRPRAMGWRVLARLEFEQEDVKLHRSVMVALDRLLSPFSPVTYREKDGITLSFELQDAGSESRDLAQALLQRAEKLAPTTRLVSAEIHEIDREAMAERLGTGHRTAGRTN